MLKTPFAVLAVLSVSAAAYPESDINNLRQLMTGHFSTNRHHRSNPDGKRAALVFLNETFQSYGLQTWDWTFFANNKKYKGTTILGLWPGRNTGTPLDRPIMLTANVDTNYNKPGVDDNGSGMAAVVESARLITSQTCIQDHSVFFAVFDFEEHPIYDPQPDEPCEVGACGSTEFVQGVMSLYRQAVNSDVAKWGGVVVLNAVLNYNNTEMSQNMINETIFKETPGLEDAYEHIKEDKYRGNFMSVIYRGDGDSSLHDAFTNKWSAAADHQGRVESVILPYKNITSVVDNQIGPFWEVYKYIIMHDVYSFWKYMQDVPAILVSDTGELRGRKKPFDLCGPDDNMELTEERLQFLKKTTDVSTAVIRGKAGTREKCRDPTAEAPANFKDGLELYGEMTMGPSDRSSYTLLISSFTSTGIVHAILSNTTWSKDFAGRYDGDTHLLLLRPKPMLEDYGTLLCGMTGNLEKLSDGVLYSGRMSGKCGISGATSEYITFVLYSQQDAIGGGPTLALPVILSLACGIFVTAMAAWCIARRRNADQALRMPILSKAT